MTGERVIVRVGEIRTAGAADTLVTVGVGSCVAVVLLDPAARIAGMAHALLPARLRPAPQAPPGRFVPTAVSVLIELMEARGARTARLRAALAGGATMFEALAARGGGVGARNVEAARAGLAALGVPAPFEDVGGAHGRTVRLSVGDGELHITSVGRPDVVHRL